MNRKEILEKYKKEEEILLISKVLDKICFVKEKNKVMTTDFLDPYEQTIVEKELRHLKIAEYLFFGGYKEAERKILILYPEKLRDLFQNEKWKPNNYLHVLRISLPKALEGVYKHRNYLGGIMKLGVKREKIGDILVGEEGADIIILPEIENYLQYNVPELTRFQKAKMEIELIENIRESNIKTEVFEIQVASMRNDCVVAELMHTSRKKACEVIKSGRVFINFIPEVKEAKEIKEQDRITIRGKGRFCIKAWVRNTKSGRDVLKIEKYV